MNVELIVILKDVVHFTNSKGRLTQGEHKLLMDHINSLEDLTIRNDAIALIDALGHNNQHIKQDTAAGALAKVCVMLTAFGSKPDAMLAVIHDKGWEVVTLADVEAVRKHLLEY